MGFGQVPEEYEIRLGFLSETLEMLEDTESDFLKLEKNPGDKSIIERIFRLAHTIKGSAQLVEFNELGSFAHAMEFLLVKIRENKVEITTDVIDVLLKSNDLLKSFAQALQDDHGAHVDSQEVLLRLNKYLSPSAPSPVHSAPAAAKETAAHQPAGSERLAELCMRTYLLHMQLLKMHGDEIMTTDMMEVKGNLESSLKELSILLK